WRRSSRADRRRLPWRSRPGGRGRASRSLRERVGRDADHALPEDEVGPHVVGGDPREEREDAPRQRLERGEERPGEEGAQRRDAKDHEGERYDQRPRERAVHAWGAAAPMVACLERNSSFTLSKSPIVPTSFQ